MFFRPIRGRARRCAPTRRPARPPGASRVPAPSCHRFQHNARPRSLGPAESNAGQDYTRAMETPAEYVFSPGTGATPPALTGREEEQSVLSRCLAAMASGKAPAHDVVLVGPRGNGKTVLLNWFATACRASRRRVDALTLTPSDIADRQALMEALAPRRALARLLPRARPNGRVGSLLRKLLAVISLRCDGRSLAVALTARCRRRPLAVLLDEAHTLNIKVGGALLNASQQARATAPFLLVLAGTPGLPRRLDAMDASFWGRLADGLLGIGRLSASAAKEALTKPLLAHDVSIEAETHWLKRRNTASATPTSSSSGATRCGNSIWPPASVASRPITSPRRYRTWPHE